MTAVSNNWCRSSDPRFQVVAERLNIAPLVALCLDYCDTIFHSPQDAAYFFHRNVEWVLPAREPLHIHNVSLITKNQTESPSPVVSPVEDLGRFLSTLVAPFAKRVEFVAPEPGDCMFSNLPTSNDCFFLCNKEVVFKTATTLIEFRLSDLFRLMVSVSLQQVTFDPTQEVRIWGFSAQEYEEMSQGHMGQILQRRSLPGMSFGNSFRAAGGILRPVLGNGSYYGLQSFDRTAPLTITLDFLHTHATLDSFLKYLDIFREISLQSKQALEVNDERIELLLSEFDLYFEGFEKFRFVFDQMILCRGKVFEWIAPPKKKTRAKWHESPTAVSITPKEQPLVLRPILARELHTTLKVLEEMLVAARLGFLALAPGQKLHLFGMSEEEHASAIKDIFARNIFPRQNPKGFVWRIRCKIGFDVESGTIVRNSDGKEISYLTLIPKKGETDFRLVLEPIALTATADSKDSKIINAV